MEITRAEEIQGIKRTSYDSEFERVLEEIIKTLDTKILNTVLSQRTYILYETDIMREYNLYRTEPRDYFPKLKKFLGDAGYSVVVYRSCLKISW